VLDQLAAQDYRYTVLAKRPDDTREASVVGSILDGVLAPDEPRRAQEVLARPEIRIVTLTITEGGYHLDQVTGELVVDDALRADLRPGSSPTTTPGHLVAALAARRKRGIAPFAVVSCDNLPGNGDLARRLVVGFARLLDPEQAAWIDASVSFPNSMVDRITPATTAADRLLLRQEFGIDDACPVVCESHLQWVLQDEFPAGRPAWELAGVQLVVDVEPYEHLKLRILNAGHQLLAQPGRLLGLQSVADAAADRDLAALFADYVRLEAAPTVQPLPDTDPLDYGRDVLERFGNPQIADPLARICADASDRIPKFVLPVARDQVTRGGPIDRCALVVAAWARSAEGFDDHGAPLETVDPRRDEIVGRARLSAADPSAFLRDPALFGGLAIDPAFVRAFAEALGSLRRYGTRTTLQRWT
jgi:mannitol 2-dehydrogenase